MAPQQSAKFRTAYFCQICSSLWRRQLWINLYAVSTIC